MEHHLEYNLAEYPLCFLALPPYFAEQLLIAPSAVLWQRVENYFFVRKEIMIEKMRIYLSDLLCISLENKFVQVKLLTLVAPGFFGLMKPRGGGAHCAPPA